MSFIDPNVHTPVPAAQRACYTVEGVEHVPDHVIVVGDEWYTLDALKAGVEHRMNRPK